MKRSSLGEFEHPVDDLLRGLRATSLPHWGQCGIDPLAKSSRR